MRSFPGWTNNTAKSCFPDTLEWLFVLFQNHGMVEQAISFVKNDLEPPASFEGRRIESLTVRHLVATVRHLVACSRRVL